MGSTRRNRSKSHDDHDNFDGHHCLPLVPQPSNKNAKASQPLRESPAAKYGTCDIDSVKTTLTPVLWEIPTRISCFSPTEATVKIHANDDDCNLQMLHSTLSPLQDETNNNPQLFPLLLSHVNASLKSKSQLNEFWAAIDTMSWCWTSIIDPTDY